MVHLACSRARPLVLASSSGSQDKDMNKGGSWTGGPKRAFVATRKKFSGVAKRLRLVSDRIKEAHVQNIEKLDQLAKDDVELASVVFKDLHDDDDNGLKP